MSGINKIVSVYKLPPTRLQFLDLPEFPHPCLNAGDFNCRYVKWGYNDNRPDGECFAGHIQCQGRRQFLLRPLKHWHQSIYSFR